MAIEKGTSAPRGSVSLLVMVAENGYVIREGSDFSSTTTKTHVARDEEELMTVLAQLCGVEVFA